VGVAAHESAHPETLIARMRQSIADVVAAGELEVFTSRDSDVLHWPERRAAG
jgi:hypothetical protein